MKPIEQCLDEILKELKKSYDTDGRPPIDFDRLQKYFDTKLQRHELFKGLLDILIEEKNAKWIEGTVKQIDPDSILNDYRNNIIITPKGLYLIEQNGYVQQKIINDAENIRLANLEKHQIRHCNQMFWLTLILSVAALIASVWYGIEIYRFWYSCYHG